MEMKTEAFENKLDHQRRDLEKKNAKIADLEIRLEEVKKKEKNEKQIRERKMKDLENTIKGMTKEESNSTENFQCSECEFASKSQNGVKTHKARMHTKTEKLKNPIDCELCDASLENEKDMKEHLNYHKYKKTTFNCKDCDYWCENFLTMEVHVGKFHSETLECVAGKQKILKV